MSRGAALTGALAIAALTGLVIFPFPAAHAAPATGCATSQLRQVTAPGPARELSGSVPVVFIHGILSTAAMWEGSSATSLAGQAARMGHATAWTFDYGPQNLDWVTNPAIGPAFARDVSCLAEVSGHQVVIVAHSMGGLAAQFAVSQPDPYGGKVADHVAEVITIGTPYLGSWLLSAAQELRAGARWTQPVKYRIAAEVIESACAGTSSGICGWLKALPSEVGTALQPHSTDIKNLPPWPPGLRVYDAAGDIGLDYLVSGIPSASLDVGDGVVSVDSATAHNTVSKALEEACGKQAIWNLIHGDSGPCFHLNLVANPDVIQSVRTAILARINDAVLPEWTPARIAAGPITSVSCTGQFCGAVGATGSCVGLYCAAAPAAGNIGQGFALTYSGGAWSKPVSIGTGDTYTVSCPAADHCVAVTDTGYAYTFTGTTWSGATDMYPDANNQASANDQVEDLSCATPRFCVAVTGEGKAITWNGSSWSGPQDMGLWGIQPPVVPGDFTPLGVACPTAAFCISGTSGGGPSGPSATWNGTRWSAAPDNPLMAWYWRVSCASPAFCMAAGGAHAGGDMSSVWDGTTWSPIAQPADQGPAVGFAAVSCPADGFCVAIDGGASVNGAVAATERGAGVFTWSHGAWSGPELIDSNGYIDAISCSASGLCAVTDDKGNVFMNPAGGKA